MTQIGYIRRELKVLETYVFENETYEIRGVVYRESDGTTWIVVPAWGQVFEIDPEKTFMRTWRMEGSNLVFPQKGEIDSTARTILANVEKDPSLVLSVQRVRAEGEGYLGGHNTAARKGWRVSYPPKEEGAVLSWDDSHRGTWTKYHPARVSLVM
jgi:hypothetical protein